MAIREPSTSATLTSQPPATSEDEPSIRFVVVENVDALDPYLSAWDALAERLGKPFCAPGWLLSWWREARTGDARLRVVLVFDGSELVAVGPFFAQIAFGLVELRLLAAGFSHRIGVLASSDDPSSVALALATGLASVKPRAASIVFEGIDGEDRWPELIAGGWPSKRRPRTRTDATMLAPVIELNGSFEDWMERRERRFRKEARRTARRMEEEGVEGHVQADEGAIGALLRLHQARWQGRGGSSIGETALPMLERAVRELGPTRRLWVAMLSAPAGPVAAELVLRAGDTAVFWAGGFDPAWARNAPGTQAMLLALRQLAGEGVQLADLGGGASDYKHRLADRDTQIVWRTVFPRGLRYPFIRARLAPKHTWFALRRISQRLPPSVLDGLKRARSGLARSSSK